MHIHRVDLASEDHLGVMVDMEDSGVAEVVMAEDRGYLMHIKLLGPILLTKIE